MADHAFVVGGNERWRFTAWGPAIRFRAEALEWMRSRPDARLRGSRSSPAHPPITIRRRLPKFERTDRESADETSMDPDEGLPWPGQSDRRLVEVESGRFAKGTRYLLKPITIVVAEVTPRTPQRRLAAMELGFDCRRNRYSNCEPLVGWVEALRNPPCPSSGLRKAFTHLQPLEPPAEFGAIQLTAKCWLVTAAGAKPMSTLSQMMKRAAGPTVR
jgi:hypothetical protein